VWDQLPAGKQVKPAAALAESIRERHARAKSVVYQTQLRMWIAEGIRREAKRHEA